MEPDGCCCWCIFAFFVLPQPAPFDAVYFYALCFLLIFNEDLGYVLDIALGALEAAENTTIHAMQRFTLFFFLSLSEWHGSTNEQTTNAFLSVRCKSADCTVRNVSGSVQNIAGIPVCTDAWRASFITTNNFATPTDAFMVYRCRCCCCCCNRQDCCNAKRSEKRI